MRKTAFSAALLMLVMFFGFGAAQADPLPLINNGGGLIYDPNLNITWYDYTYSGPTGNGCTSEQAMSWAAGLNLGGVTGWQLPQALPVNGSTYNNGWSWNGSTDLGYNISAPGSAYPGSTASQMAYLYYVELGNKGYADINGNYPQPGWGLVNQGPFSNLQAARYCWTQSVPWGDWASYGQGPLTFAFSAGSQNTAGLVDPSNGAALAVHPGDVQPVPLAVDSTSPASDATNVPVGSGISAAFNMEMTASTINTSTFTLSKGVTGTVTYNPSTMTATFTPSAPLAYDTTYAATITTGAEGSGGQGLGQAYTWSFTTAAASLPLSIGWNLVSLPLQQANTSATSVLSGMSGSYSVVWGYYPNQSWEFYDPSNQSGSTLQNMQAGSGYWINTSSGGTLAISGSTPPSSLSLSNGWNLVGYSGSSCASASTALASLGKTLEVSWSYAGQAWKVYDPNDAAGNTLTQFCPNNGYWIRVNGTPTWSGW